jgi:transposase
MNQKSLLLMLATAATISAEVVRYARAALSIDEFMEWIGIAQPAREGRQ